MILRVTHLTVYEYEDTVSVCHNELRLTPRSTPRQTARRSQLLVDPPPAVLTAQPDFFGNPMSFMTLQEPHRRLAITAMSDVEVKRRTETPSDTLSWETVRDALRAERSPEGLEAYQFTFASPSVRWNDDVRHWAEASFPPGRTVLPGVLDLTHRIHAEFAYDPAATTVATPIEQVLRERRGVCQDFAHLEIACLRALGLPARYVSGYVLNTPPDGGAPSTGAEASHAWVSVFVPEAGWVDVDPTNDSMPSGEHVTLGWGRDYGDVSPVKGVVLGGGEHRMRVSVDVVPIGGTSA